MRDADLNNEFEYVRNTFFPRWDKKKDWKVEIFSGWVDHLTGTDYTGKGIVPPLVGTCNRKTKTIYLRCAQKESLIHEICHAVSNDHHGERWRNKMEEKAQLADRLGNNILALEIRLGYVVYKKNYADELSNYQLKLVELLKKNRKQ